MTSGDNSKAIAIARSWEGIKYLTTHPSPVICAVLCERRLTDDFLIYMSVCYYESVHMPD